MSRLILNTGLLITVAVSLSACDFFRSLAGRPTSADIASKREKLELEEASHRTRMENLAATQKVVEDSLSFADSVMLAENSVVKPGNLSGVSAAQLSHRYYIAVGAFSSVENAEKQAAAAVAAGFDVTTVDLRNGNKLVLLCPSDNLREVYAKFSSVKKERFCPPDVWVLVNE